MKVTINNKETETQAKTIRELAQELDLPATGVAVAISNEMVPRDEWENTNHRRRSRHHYRKSVLRRITVPEYCGKESHKSTFPTEMKTKITTL